MSQGTDVTGVLAWGVRKHAWLIALFVVALGIVVPALLERTPNRYEASAQVGPTRVLRVPNTDILPRMATDVFRNVPDDPAVRAAAGASDSPKLGTDQLQLVAAQDNIIFTVVARSTSPEVARDVANVAAETITVADVAALAEGREPVGGAAWTVRSPYAYEHTVAGYLGRRVAT